MKSHLKKRKELNLKILKELKKSTSKKSIIASEKILGEYYAIR